MPDENKNNAGGSGDDAAAAAANAAAAAAAAGAGAGDGAGSGEEMVTIKKSEWDKTLEDKENYRKMGIDKKAEERRLREEGEAAAGAGAGAVDEKKVSETATAAASKVLRDAADRTAKREFLTDHQEYLDDESWKSLLAHLTFRGTELTKEEIRDRMEAAVLEHKRATGKLDEYMASQRERGIREGRIQGSVEAGAGSGGAGDRSGGSSNASILSDKGRDMARGMHIDPEKAAKADPSKDNVIRNI